MCTGNLFLLNAVVTVINLTKINWKLLKSNSEPWNHIGIRRKVPFSWLLDHFQSFKSDYNGYDAQKGYYGSTWSFWIYLRPLATFWIYKRSAVSLLGFLNLLNSTQVSFRLKQSIESHWSSLWRTKVHLGLRRVHYSFQRDILNHKSSFVSFGVPELTEEHPVSFGFLKLLRVPSLLSYGTS